MSKKLALLSITIGSILISGCAAKPDIRQEFSNLPTLESGWSRIHVSAGKMNGVRLWSIHQVGPVYINSKAVGSTAKNEHIAVDLMPGEYEIYCTSHEPVKNYPEKLTIKVTSNQNYNFVCDMTNKGIGGSLGLVGVMASEYITKSYLDERPLDNPDSKIVSYMKMK
ncbi:DUF2846 domain-containing protein [Pseudomonadota bacterium]